MSLDYVSKVYSTYTDLSGDRLLKYDFKKSNQGANTRGTQPYYNLKKKE